MAGIIGIDPSPFTFCELTNMAHAKNLADWNRTSHVLALLININRDKGKPRVNPKDLNPYNDQHINTAEPDFYISPAQLAKHLTKS